MTEDEKIAKYGPAVSNRCHDHPDPSFNYPVRFMDRVPKTVRLTQDVRSVRFMDRGDPLASVPLVARYGAEFPAWTNSHGAVSATLPCGNRLGLLPGEYEVTEWL